MVVSPAGTMKKTYAVLPALALVAAWSLAQPSADPLETGFRNPPDSAMPRTWWHWTGGNITKDGITKDLEWMKRAGIGGFQLADVSMGSGQTVEKKIWFGSPEWYEALKHAATEADRLGLEMTIFSSPGWSEAGGPWVKPEQAMKKLVWSRTEVEGPRAFDGRLTQPPSTNGPFGDLATGGERAGLPPDPTYYGDSAVIAYRTPADETDMASLHPKITTQAGPVDAAALLDDNLNTSLTIPAPTGGGPAWVEFEFEQPFPARAITLAARGGIPVGRVLASDDGSGFRTLVTLPGPQLYRGGTVRTFAFPETAARFFRVELDDAPLAPAAVMSEPAPQPAREYTLSEVKLHSGARVNRWEEKAGFSFLFQYNTVPTPAVPPADTIPASAVVDLTSKMAADGALKWDIPAGKWTILRMGYSLTGSKNKPPVPSGSGYEADKLSRKDIESYFHGYMDPIASALGPLFGKTLRYVVMDSYEAGMQNWTDDMLREFRKRRGYDPTPYLPALTGRIVGSAAISDRFLWDFRRTLADMFADSFYGTMADMLRERGLGSYGEAAGVSLEIPEDTLLNKSKVDIPMAEFWVHPLHPWMMYYVDVRGAASAAHAYGKPLVAAESFTGGGYEAPYTLKKVSDYWLTQGINRLVFHTSAHQPLDTKPGNTMVGTHLNRNITWAGQAKPFMTYLARNSFMLQQGRFVADLAYLLPEGAPATMPFWGEGLRPQLPEGYDYDFVNTDIVENRMSTTSDGRLLLPDGMSYRVLVLPEVRTMTLPLIRKLHELVEAGATVVGPKPLRAPGLTGYPDADAQVQALAADLWGDLDGISRTRHGFGKGEVIWGQRLPEVLSSMHVVRDFESTLPLDTEISWIHRRAEDADIYFVVNGADAPRDIEARFRVSGKAPELWHADTGSIEPADYRISGDRTTVPLHLAERQAVFVVFRHPAAAPSRTTTRITPVTLSTVNGSWDVTFPPDLGAPSKIELPRLESWTANADPGVKFFSGTATYTKSFDAPAAWLKGGGRLLLDLGIVRDLAEVRLNGKPVGDLWKPPYRVDITTALKNGANELEVRVTNEWTNRIVGDRLVPAAQRVFAPLSGGSGRGGMFGPQTPAESGLLGPVVLMRE
jgi:hypothetical protein